MRMATTVKWDTRPFHATHLVKKQQGSMRGRTGIHEQPKWAAQQCDWLKIFV